MELLTILITSTFLILWNILAVVGLVFLIVKLARALDPSNRSQKNKANRDNTFKKKSTKPLEVGVIFLNISIILLWITTLFLGFSSSFISDQSMTQWYLIGMMLVYFGFVYLTSRSQKFKSSFRLSLYLSFISIIYFGVRYWTQNLSIYAPLQSSDYFMLLSLFIAGISLLYYKLLNKKTFLLFFTIFIITTICLIAPTAFNNNIYRFPFILTVTPFVYLITRQFLRRDKNYQNVVLPIFRIAVIIIGLAHIGYILINQYSIDTPKETIANAIALFIPTFFTFIVKALEKRGFTLIIEGLLLPTRIIMTLSMVLLGASSSHAWAISLILFVGAGVFSCTQLYQKPSFRRFIFPVMLSGLIGSLWYMLVQPFYIENFDPFAIGITLLVIQVFIAIKSLRYNFNKLRLVEPFLQVAAILSILYSLDLNYSTNVYTAEVFALVLVIPSTISIVEGLLSHKLQMTRYTSFNALFLLVIATILTITSPVLNLFISTYSIIVLFVMTYLHNTPLFGFPITTLALISTTALAKIIGVGGIEILILNGVVLTVFGNLWRIANILKRSNGLTYDLFHDMRRTSVMIASFLLLYSFLTINYTDHMITVFYALLSILFLSSPTKESRLRYISGVGLVLIYWHLINISDTPQYANAQLYAFPVVLLTLIASIKAEGSSKFISRLGLFLAISLPMNIAILQSIFDPHPFNLIQGLSLILITLVLSIYGLIKKNGLLKYLSIVYMTMEILIIWIRYAEIIPWWLYPAIIGLIFLYLSLRITLGISDSFKKN